MGEQGRPAIADIFSRPVSLTETALPPRGRIEASSEERAALAAQFGIESLDSFTFDYMFKPIVSGRYRLTGTLRAQVIQLCVLTVEPLTSLIEEAVKVECWPQDQIETLETEAVVIDPEAIAEEPPAMIVNDKVDVGALAAEILASAIDPYPRKEGAEFDWSDPAAADAAASGPFAQLAKLKSKS
jgi:hypothetical protein